MAYARSAEVDPFIGMLLSKCLEEPNNDDSSDLFRACRTNILSSCTALLENPTILGELLSELFPVSLKRHETACLQIMTQLCRTERISRYPHFVKVANTALDALTAEFGFLSSRQRSDGTLYQ